MLKGTTVKKSAVRFVVLFLAVALILSMAACGKTKDTEETTTAGTTKAAQAGQETTKEASFEPVQLDMLSLPSNEPGLYDNTWWGKILKEQVGVILNILPGGGAEGDQKLQAMMAAGELPDLVVFKSAKQVQDAARANLLLNLDENIDKLPNASKNIPVAMQYYRDTVGNGVLYALPNNVGPEVTGSAPNFGPWLRWDLYKKLGFPEINTLEDYLTVLKQMQEIYPTTETGQKVYGFSLWKDWDGAMMHQGCALAPMIGKDCGDDLGDMPFLEADYHTFETNMALEEDGTYMRTLRIYFKANQMGLMDPDSLTQTFETARSKAYEGRVLFSWWEWFCNEFNTPDRVNADDPVGFVYIPTKENRNIFGENSPIGFNWAFGIGAGTKHPDACLRYLDFMYSVDGLMQLMNGPKGYTWDVDENGRPYLTDIGLQMTTDWDQEMEGGGAFGDGTSIVNSVGLAGGFTDSATGETLHYTGWQSFRDYELGNPTKLQQAWQQKFGYRTIIDYLIGEGMDTKQPLIPALVPPMPDDMALMVDEIGDVVTVYSWSMVFAKDEEEFNKLYQEMMEKAKGLGLMDVYNNWSLKTFNELKELVKKYE